MKQAENSDIIRQSISSHPQNNQIQIQDKKSVLYHSKLLNKYEKRRY